jgi:hypothetical protein
MKTSHFPIYFLIPHKHRAIGDAYIYRNLNVIREIIVYLQNEIHQNF